MDQPAATDLLDRIIGIEPDSALSRVRAQRPDIVRHTQGSHDVLLMPQDPHGLSLAERAFVATRTAELAGHTALATHYRKLLEQRGGVPTDASAPVIREFVERVATAPDTATREHIIPLRAIGLRARDIVALTQIVAFVSYQVRAAAGLSLLAQEKAA